MTSYRGIATIACLALGVLCPALHAVAQADPLVASSTTMSAFQAAHRAVLAESPDQSLWSASRRTGYRESLAFGLDAPDGLLHVPAIDLSVPIFGGTTEVVLNRGIGWIESTARPGAGGNVGLAGHRDGFFRGFEGFEDWGCHRAADRRRDSTISRDRVLNSRPDRCFRDRANARAGGHARDLLPVLFRRPCSAALHRAWSDRLSSHCNLWSVVGAVCPYRLFMRHRSRCHPDILVMQTTDVLEIPHDALGRWLDDSALRSILR